MIFLLLVLCGSSFGAINTRPTEYTEYIAEFSGIVTDRSITVGNFSSRDTKYYNWLLDSNENFRINFTTSFSAIASGAVVLPIAFTNVAGDGVDFGSSNYFGCYFTSNGATHTFFASGYTSGGTVTSTGYTYTFNEILYGTIIKEGSSLSIELYDDVARGVGDLLSTETLPASVSDTYTHIVMMAGSDSGAGGLVSGSISDIYDVSDLATHNLTISTDRGAWTAVSSNNVHYGPVTSGSLDLFPGEYNIYFRSEDGYRGKLDLNIALNDVINTTSDYVSEATLAGVVQVSDGVFPLGRLADISGNDNNLVLLGSIDSVADEQGSLDSAYFFDGTLLVSRLQSTDVSYDYLSSFSGGYKFNPSAIGQTHTILTDWGVVDTDKKFISGVSSANDKYFFFVRDTTNTDYIVESTTLAQVGVDRYVEWVFDDDNDEIRIYIDGTLEGTTVFTGTVQSGVGTITIGGYHSGFGSDPTHGRIDDVFIMSGVLPQAGITDYGNTETDFSIPTLGTLDVAITGSTLTSFSVNDGVATYGNFESGAHAVKAGTYTISFNSAVGYPSPPNDIVGVVVTDSSTTNESAIYTPYPTAEIFVAIGASGTGASCLDPSDFDSVDQNTLAPGAAIKVCGQYKDIIKLERSDLKVSRADEDSYIDGAVEVTAPWVLDSGNVYYTQLNLSNIDYLQESEPGSPSVGERWIRTRWEQSDFRVISKVGRIWTGTRWADDPDWMLMPEKVWVDGVQINTAVYPSAGWNIADAMTTSSLTDSDLIGVTVGDTAIVNVKKEVWVIESMYLESETADTLTFTESNLMQPVAQMLYYISNIKSQVNAHGKWSYDYNTGRLYMYFDTAPANYLIEYSGVNHGVYSNGNSDITIDNLVIKRTNDSPIKLWGTGRGNITITNNKLDDYTARGEPAYCNAGIDLHPVDPWDYNYVTVFNEGNYDGIDRSYNLIIEDNELSNGQGAHAIAPYLFVNGSIKRNKIFNHGYADNKRILERANTSGIFPRGCWNVDVDDSNIIANTAYRGIFNMGGGALVDGNTIGNSMRVHRDGGAIGSYSISSNHNTYSNNIANDTIQSTDDTFPQYVMGIYLDQNSHHNVVINNDFYAFTGVLTAGLFDNNNTSEKPLNTYTDNNVYDNDLDSLEEGATGIFSGNTLYVESTYPTFDLTVKYEGDFNLSVNGVYSAYTPNTPHTLPQGAYVIVYEDIGGDTPDDEVIALTENIVLDRSTADDNSAMLLLLWLWATSQ